MKSFEPSKELLSDVLGYEVTEILRVHEATLIYDTSSIEVKTKASPSFPNINIYELMHIMKEWAKIEGVTHFSSWLGDNGSHARFMYGFEFHEFDASTEPEAVTKACEWILKKEKK
jgi:hypothetical protein